MNGGFVFFSLLGAVLLWFGVTPLFWPENHHWECDPYHRAVTTGLDREGCEGYDVPGPSPLRERLAGTFALGGLGLVFLFVAREHWMNPDP